MKILVTGGAGFIGSHIVDKYISIGHKVFIIDNLSSGFKKNLNKKAKFYKADIRDLSSIKKILNKEKPQIVNHHAAISEVVKSLRDPHLTYETNILGTANLLLASGESGIKKFIFISSGGAVYGNPKKLPVKEDSLLKPLSPYAFSKYLGEKFVEFYSGVFGFDYLIFRYANVYGQRQNPKGEAGVISIFTDLIKNDLQPTIFGDGSKTRDYIYIDDIIKANIAGIKKAKNEILNLGCGIEINDQQVFDTIAQKLDFNKPAIYSPFRQREVYRIVLNSNKAKKILKWKPTIDFKKGITKYIENI